MQPIDVLTNEHRIIEQVLNCLEKMTDACASNGKFDVAAARQIIDFFENFADRCHQEKEEKCLFPIMEVRGFARNRGPMSRMSYEHDRGQEKLADLAHAVEGAATGDRKAIQEFVHQARSFIYSLREHIMKEDEHLFPMVSQVLTEQDQRSLKTAFAKHEDQMGHGAHEKYLHLANALAERFEVPRASEASMVHCCCGHEAT
jgi:hemerythrin-like domain-containing protein